MSNLTTLVKSIHQSIQHNADVIDDAKDSTKLVDFLKLPPISNIALSLQIINDFGGKENYLFAIKELENTIYLGVLFNESKN